MAAEYLSTREATKRAGVTPNTLRNCLKNAEFVKRFPRRDAILARRGVSRKAAQFWRSDFVDAVATMYRFVLPQRKRSGG